MNSRALLLVVPVTAVLALAGCSLGGGSGSSGSTAAASGGGSGGGGSTPCELGSWNADLADLATQLGANLGTHLHVTSSTATGSQKLTLSADGKLVFDNAMSFDITVDENGLPVEIKQDHTGAVNADYAIAGGELTFSNFDGASYVIHNTMTVNGQSSGADTGLPTAGASNVPMAITCSGDTLTTHPDGSPFTTTWHRA